QHLKDENIIETIIPEPPHLTVENMDVVCEELKQLLFQFLETQKELSKEELVEKRYERFRRM
ncbi:MAG: acetyl-CoA carboxylase carboxyl transferase subunit beta, partial [Lachnospiraceae bacterium]